MDWIEKRALRLSMDVSNFLKWISDLHLRSGFEVKSVTVKISSIPLSPSYRWKCQCFMLGFMDFLHLSRPQYLTSSHFLLFSLFDIIFTMQWSHFTPDPEKRKHRPSKTTFLLFLFTTISQWYFSRNRTEYNLCPLLSFFLLFKECQERSLIKLLFHVTFR